VVETKTVGRDLAKDFHAAFLAVDEAVLFGGVEGVAAPDLKVRSGQSLFRATFETTRAWRNRQTHRT
jgi:hypothetical protein